LQDSSAPSLRWIARRARERLGASRATPSIDSLREAVMRGRWQLRPPWNLPVALLLFVALDALVFKTGLSERIASPRSDVGAVGYLVRFETARPATPGIDDALVIGASDVAYALNPAAAAATWPAARLRLVDGGMPGGNLRVDLYVLRKLDPRRDRYRMVVVALPYFDANQDGASDDEPNDIDQLAPILGVEDYVDFALTFPGVGRKTNALVRGFVGSAHWARQWRSFAMAPRRRLTEIARRERAGANYSYASNPDDERTLLTMIGLGLDPITGALRIPPRLAQRDRDLLRRFTRPRPRERAMELALDQAAYSHEWLGRIVSYYRGSRTRVVFVRMPAGPIRYARLEPPPGAPSIVDEFRHEPGVTILDPQLFTFLEKPELYFDPRHLNRAGSVEFSKTLLGALLPLEAP
jgi:hypothetical protein